jgi:hypothetical protein
VSLDPRWIATLGVGYGARAIAYLGLWPSTTPPQPPTVGHGYGFLPERQKRRDTDDDALVLLLI